MTLDDAVKYALCVHEALRRLGFAAADIFVATQPRGADTVALYVVIKTQGKEWRYVADDCVASSVPQFELAWVRSVALHNGGTPGGLIGTPGSGGQWDRWIAQTSLPSLAMSIVGKGIDLPAVARRRAN